MLGRTLSGFTVLAMAGVLSGVLSGHLWNRYSQETEALGFSGIYERYLASQAGFGDDAQGYRAASREATDDSASFGASTVPGKCAPNCWLMNEA
jgi:hypothetical protein